MPEESDTPKRSEPNGSGFPMSHWGRGVHKSAEVRSAKCLGLWWGFVLGIGLSGEAGL